MSDSPRQVDWQQLLILAEERPPPSNGVRKIVVIVPLVTGLASSKEAMSVMHSTDREGRENCGEDLVKSHQFIPNSSPDVYLPRIAPFHGELCNCL